MQLPQTFDQAEVPDLGIESFLDDRPMFRQTWQHRVLPPMQLTQEEAELLFAEVKALSELMLSIPGRFFNNDLTTFGGDLGVSQDVDDVLRSFVLPVRRNLRADVVLSPAGPRVVEVNWGSRLGGYDLDALYEYAEKQVGARADLRFIGTPPCRSAVSAIRQALPANQLESELDVVMVCGGAVDVAQPMIRGIAATFERSFPNLRLIRLEQLADYLGQRDEQTFLIVLRYFQADDLVVDPVAMAAVSEVQALELQGRALLWTSPVGAYFASKGVLALLHRLRVAGWLTATESEMVKKLVPETFTVSDLPKRWSQAAARLGPKEDWVLKPMRDFAGGNITFGSEVDERSWQRIWSRATNGSYVVQRTVDSIPWSVPASGDGVRRDWRVVLGVYLVPDVDGGLVIRARPFDETSLVNANGSATVRVATAVIVGSREPVTAPR